MSFVVAHCVDGCWVIDVDAPVTANGYAYAPNPVAAERIVELLNTHGLVDVPANIAEAAP